MINVRQQSMRRGVWVVALAVIAVATTGLAAQRDKDIDGSRDHPMISRIEGSHIIAFDSKEFDEYRLVRERVSVYRNVSGNVRAWDDVEDALNDDNSLHLEGKVWRLTYETPKNRSTLEIIRSYQTGLTNAGFETLYQCSNRECVGPKPSGAHSKSTWLGALSRLLMQRGGFRVSGNYYDDQRYLAARLARAEGDIYVSVLALGLRKPVARVDVIEVKPMTSDLVTVDAAMMAGDLETQGSVALYGIYFDTDRAEIKPESRPTLAEIAKLLAQNRSLDLIVVGHTDSQGTLEHNLDLSLRRGQAVVATLVSDFGVARERLEARGVGSLAPVAPNSDEAGRAKNRRVELLQRP